MRWLATITAVFSGEERGAAIGTWTAYTGIAFVIGPLAGGWFVKVASWRAIFLINPPLVVATMLLASYALRGAAHTQKHARVDFLGGFLCVAGLGGPVFALIEQPKRGWSDPLILVSLLGGSTLFALFVGW